MDEGRLHIPRNVEAVFTDFKGRRAALIEALTTDFKTFFEQSHPDRDNLCLYGYPDGKWEVKAPPVQICLELPEPALGLNFARDGMEKKEWLKLVALHSDSWLHAVAFHRSTTVYRFQKADRQRLFTLMNTLPTIFEVVTGKAAKQKSKKYSSLSKDSSNKSKYYSKGGTSQSDKHSERPQVKNKEDNEEYIDNLCGICRLCETSTDEFWIFCETCNTWFHMKCVGMTPAMADLIPQYECLLCTS